MTAKKSESVIAYIGLGSNLGDRAGYIDSALAAIAGMENIALLKMSKMVETSPLGGKKQPNYFNRVAQIKTTLTPEKLLDKLQFIEQKFGRVRDGKVNTSRTIDLDILLFSDKIIETPTLKVPHPRIHLRSFVLDGICEIDDSVIHPAMKQTAATLKQRLGGQDFVCDRYEKKLVSIAGVVGVGKTTLTRSLAVLADAQMIEENYEDNPYLARVYHGETELALKSELYFLNSSVSQLGNDTLQKGKLYISDYIFHKAFVFANRWLGPQDMVVYAREYQNLAVRVVKPSVIIYLKDDLDKCVSRIKLRNRPFENQIKREFLENLESDYDKLFAGLTDCPVITIDASEFNTLNSDDVKSLSQEIEMYL